MNKSNTISCHQVGIIAGAMLLVLKLTSLPSLLYTGSEMGGVISIALICLFNIAFLALIVFVKKKHKNCNLYSIFCNIFGKIVTKLVYFVLFVFFMFKLLALVDDGFGFVRDVADEEFTFFNYIICFFPVIVALAYSGIRNLSRTAEFFFPFVLIGLFISIIFSFAPLNFFGLGAVSRINFGDTFSKLYELSFWNGDLFAILIFMDRIDLSKGKIRHIFSPIILVSIFLIAGYSMYYSLYQQTSILHSNMIFDIVEYTIGTSSGWHMDIFAIIVFVVCLYLQGGIYLYCCVKTIERVFAFNNQYIIYAGIIFTLILVQFLYLNDYLKYVIFAKTYLSVFGAILLILIPLLMIATIVFKRREYGRYYAKNEKSV